MNLQIGPDSPRMLDLCSKFSQLVLSKRTAYSKVEGNLLVGVSCAGVEASLLVRIKSVSQGGGEYVGGQDQWSG